MDKPFQKKAVVTIAASHTLNDVFASFFAPLLPLLSQKLGFSLASAGLLSTVEKIPQLLNPLIGIIADKWVVKWFLIISPLITSIAMSFLGNVSSVGEIAFVLLVSGFSSALYHTTAPVLMRQVSGSKVGTGMSAFMFGGELARTLGPLVIMGAVSIWGIEGTWRLIPFGITGAIILYFQLHRLPDIRPEKKVKSENNSLIISLKELKPLFFIIAPMLLFRAFSKTALTTFLPTYLVQEGYTAVHAGITLSFLEAVAAGATLLSGTISDKIGRKKILVTIMALSPILMLAFTVTDGAIRLLTIAGMGALFFSSTPVFMAMVHDMNSQSPSLANGLFMTINFALTSFVAITVGHWGDLFGLKMTYQITALLTAGSIPFALMIKNEKGKQ